MQHGKLTRRSILTGTAALIFSPVAAQEKKLRSAAALIAAARAQVGVTLGYDPAYVRLAFPGGDVSPATGVCTDVVVRAYRAAFGLDLQALVHADMRSAFSAYPARWGLSRPDPNIDHRRVPNLEVFFTRQRAKLTQPSVPSDWRPGDIFTALIAGRRPHIGIVSDRSANGQPLIIHNIGFGAREEDALTAHPITGRYRWALEEI
jgi:uncharacterized protein YijF (DUF1287 family)